jgi:hypothetical protein
MFYVKRARIQLVDGHSFTVGRKDAQWLYSLKVEEEPIILSDFDPSVHPDMTGLVEIPRNAILYITYMEDKEANYFVKQIQRKWKEIIAETGVNDDSGCDWFTDGKNTYIGSEDWKVSEDLYVARLLIEIEDLEDRLDKHLKGESYVSKDS